MAAERRRVGVIGAGMVGVCAASYLQRDGHSVFLIEPGNPGRGRLVRQCRRFNASSVTPVAMPGIDQERAEMAAGPARAAVAALELPAARLALSLPLLARRRRRRRCTRRPARLRPLVGATLTALRPLVDAAGAEDFVHQRGHLYVYRSAEALAKDGLAWTLAARERGRGRRVQRRRTAPARADPVARLRARPAGARERPYQQPARPRQRGSSSIFSAGRRDRARARARLSPRRATASPRSAPMTASSPPMPRWSAPAPIRSRSPPRSATRCRSKPSAATI